MKNSNTTKTRQLKVYYGHHGNSYQQHPVIRLAGNYLMRLGFKVGDYVEITMEQNHILISRIPQDQNEA